MRQEEEDSEEENEIEENKEIIKKRAELNENEKQTTYNPGENFVEKKKTMKKMKTK